MRDAPFSFSFMRERHCENKRTIVFERWMWVEYVGR